MILHLEDLQNKIQKIPLLKNGCIIDTNLLFAASFPLDAFNEWAEKVFETLHSFKIPIYTNLNVRSEFIELNRRVLIPEGLIDFYEDLSGNLNPEIEQQLKSLKTLKQRASSEGRTFKFSDTDIKKYKKLLNSFTHKSGIKGWDIFCKEYLQDAITNVWTAAVSSLNIQFLGTKEIESGTYFTSRPRWHDMVEIVGRTGIGTADAMIVNLFEKSKFSLIITSDKDVESAVETLTADRYVIAPQ